MPSGAKKRKAAKKKKEKEETSEFHTNHPQGNDELKSQDERGSDGDHEGDSPAHGDHDHSFNEVVEEAEEKDPSGVRSFASVAKPLEGDAGDDKIGEVEGRKEGAVVTEWDLNSEESSENKDVSVARDESAKELDSENGNSGDSNHQAETVKDLKDEPDNSRKETVAVEELVEFVNSSHGKNVVVEDSDNWVPESSADSVKVVDSESEVKITDTGNASLEKSIGAQVGGTDLAVKKNEDKVFPLSDHNVGISTLEEPKSKDFDNNVSASVSVSRSPISEDSNGAKNVKHSDTAECSGNQPPVPSGPQVLQKASWLNCCGLFELLSGSNR